MDPLLSQIVEPWISFLRDWRWQHHFWDFEASLLYNLFRTRVNLWSSTHSLRLFEKREFHLERNFHQPFFLFFFLVLEKLRCISRIDRNGWIYKLSLALRACNLRLIDQRIWDKSASFNCFGVFLILQSSNLLKLSFLKFFCTHLEVWLIKTFIYTCLDLLIMPVVKCSLKAVFALRNKKRVRAGRLIVHAPNKFLVCLLEILLVLNLLIFFIFRHIVILYLVIVILRS